MKVRDEWWRPGGAAPHGVPATVAAACRLVGHDLDASAETQSRMPTLAWWLSDGGPLLPPGFVEVGLAENREKAFGFAVDGRKPAVAEIADRVQDHLVGYALIQWPLCAGGHVMRAVDRVDRAMWICGHLEVPIGSIGGNLPEQRSR